MQSVKRTKITSAILFIGSIVSALVPSLTFAQIGGENSPRRSSYPGEPSLIRGPAKTANSVSTLSQTHPSVPHQAQHSYGSTKSDESWSSPSAGLSPLDGQVQRASFQSTVSTNSFSTNESTKGTRSIELKPRSKSGAGSIAKPSSNWGAFFSVVFSLVIVLSIFFVIAWMAKKSLPQGTAKLPSEVVHVLGRTALAPRQQVYVVRFGRKLLLVSQQPGQTQTLCEISDEEEVERLAGICEAAQPNSVTRSFTDVLKQVASGKSEPTRPRVRRTA